MFITAGFNMLLLFFYQDQGKSMADIILNTYTPLMNNFEEGFSKILYRALLKANGKQLKYKYSI